MCDEGAQPILSWLREVFVIFIVLSSIKHLHSHADVHTLTTVACSWSFGEDGLSTGDSVVCGTAPPDYEGCPHG